MPNPRKIEFYFDYISPYAYLALARLQGLGARHDLEIGIRPILFAALLNAHDNIGPAEVEAKRDYIFRHCQRAAQAMDLPFACPPTHPFRPLLPLRLTLAVDDPNARIKLASAMLARLWGDGQAIDTADELTPLLDANGFDAASLLARTQDPAIKQALADQTKDAVGLGIFGVPSMILNGELFWGLDSIPQLEARLDDAPKPSETAYQNWRMVEASAARRRD